MSSPTTVDEIPWGDVPDERVATSKPRKCSHLKEWRVLRDDGSGDYECTRCGHVVSAARIAQGRRASRRGKDGERRVAKALDGRRVGQYGGAEDVEALFAVQVKSGPTFWPRTLARLLEDQRLAAAALGKAGPAVAYVETGHRGSRSNRVIVAMYADDLARALKAGQAIYTTPTEQETP